MLFLIRCESFFRVVWMASAWWQKGLCCWECVLLLQKTADGMVFVCNSVVFLHTVFIVICVFFIYYICVRHHRQSDFVRKRENFHYLLKKVRKSFGVSGKIRTFASAFRQNPASAGLCGEQSRKSSLKGLHRQRSSSTRSLPRSLRLGRG